MGLIGLFAIMFLFMFLTVPIPISIGLALVIYIMQAESGLDLVFIAQNMYVASDNFSLMAVPFFMLAGDLMKSGGLSKKIVDFARALVGNITGSLAIITVIACMFFGAISGSGPATCAAIGSIMLPAMLENGYDKGFAAGLVCVAGALGIIIPPSIPMVMYGTTVSASISTLFTAGFFAGITGGIALIIMAYIICKRRGYRGDGIPFTFSRLWTTFKSSFWALLMPVIILGGIYGGVFTATEAAAVAVIYGLIVGMFIYKTLNIKSMIEAIGNAAVMSGGILIISGVAGAMSKIMSLEHAEQVVQDIIRPVAFSPVLVLFIINILMLLIGCVMSTLPAIILFSPIFWAAVQTFDMSIYQFGLIMVFNIAIGLITPPVGLNMFAISPLADISITKLTKGAAPFLLAMFVALMLITYVPEITLFLPKLLGMSV